MCKKAFFLASNCLQTVIGGYNGDAGGEVASLSRSREEKEVDEMSLSPFRGFYDMQSEMSRMFDDMFGGLVRGGGRQAGDQPTRWAPALDVLQEDGDIVVRAELPGVKQEDVEITFHNGVLTISGERKAEEQREGSGYYIRERRYGSFRRSMTLPQGTDESSISARFQDGVLEVKVTGAAAVQEPKRIQIEGGEGSGS
jgi:HSP20 family protein